MHPAFRAQAEAFAPSQFSRALPAERHFQKALPPARKNTPLQGFPTPLPDKSPKGWAESILSRVLLLSICPESFPMESRLGLCPIRLPLSSSLELCFL